MKKKINIAEILKNCPQDMKLYCTCEDNMISDKVRLNNFRKLE